MGVTRREPWHPVVTRDSEGDDRSTTSHRAHNEQSLWALVVTGCSGPDRGECSSERSLTSKTSRRSQVGLPPWTVDIGISPVDLGFARGNDGGRVGSSSPVTGSVCRPRWRRDLEEEIEAQEGQGAGFWKRTPTSQTIRTDNAS
jgi:hypothetical protein